MKAADHKLSHEPGIVFGAPPPGELEAKDFKADWLLTAFQEHTWKIEGGIDGTSEKTTIFWDVPLYNGEKLGDEKYADLLILAKKIVFSCRSGVLGIHTNASEVTRAKHQYSIYSSLILLIRRLIQQKLSPELIGFQGMSPKLVRDIASSGLNGRPFVDGTYEAMKQILEKARTENVLSKYQKPRTGELDFGALYEELDEPSAKGSFSIRLRAALSEYDRCPMPEYIDYKYSSGSIHPSTRAIKTQEVISTPVSESTLMGMLSSLNTLGALAESWPELSGLEWCSEVNVKELAQDIGYSPKGRTPTIPIEIALHYLDAAIFWIIEVGPELIKLKKQCDKDLLRIMRSVTKKKENAAKRIEITVPTELKTKLAARGIEIVRYNRYSTGTHHKKIKEAMTLEDAIACLTAAAFILVATFSCKRISEVLALSEQALRPSLDGGWELVFGLKKSSPSENLRKVGRPIPTVVKSACELLLDLYPSCIDLPDDLALRPIFVNNFTENGKKRTPRFASSNTIYRYLELFADVIEVPLNENNERWYLRSHELRRFFAITYFWHDRFAGLAALSWFMGHNSIDETMHYVIEEIAGAELPEEEARFTAAILQDSADTFQIDGLDNLEEEAKEHFDVNDLKIIKAEILESYLEKRYRDGYRIIKHGHESAKVVYLEEYRG